jgi:hypothetical protein
MKAIDLSKNSPSLSEVLRLAGEDNVILRTPEGRQFVLAEIDDFAEEIQAVLKNNALGQLLEERSKETPTLTLSQVREQLQEKKQSAKGQKGKSQAPTKPRGNGTGP